MAAGLALLGLARNNKKGSWEPSTRQEHMGVGIDTGRGLFCLTPKRLAKLQLAARDILGVSGSRDGLISKRRLAGFAGLAESASLAVRPARHHLRSLYDVLATGKGWGGLVRLDHQARADLLFFVHLPER